MSYFKTTVLSVSMLALGLSLSSTAFAQSASIGVNAAVKGNVTVASAEQAAKQAVVTEPVFLGHVINAKKLSSLQVLLKDQTVFTVGPECELTIDKFVYDPSKNNNSLSATVQKGMFRFMSGNVSKMGASKVSINTPVGSMGIRGTMVEGVIGAEATAIALAEGVVPVGTAIDTAGATLFVLRGPGPNRMGTNRKGEISVTSGGQTVVVTGSNQAVFVPNVNAAPIVFSLSLVAYQNFSNSLRTSPTSPNTYNSFEIDKHFSGEAPAGQSAQQANPSQSGTSTGTGAGTVGTTVGTVGAGTAGSFGLVVAAIGGVGVLVAVQEKDRDSSN